MKRITRAGTRATQQRTSKQSNYSTGFNIIASQLIIATTYFFAMRVIYPAIAYLGGFYG